MITLNNLTKKYEKKTIIDNLSLEINDVGITAISGPSGVGKTSLLRILAGLDKEYSGTITGLENKKISYMFQEDRLFEHLTALENVSIVSDENTAKINLENVGLMDYLNYLPNQLSGGMCRRVALARAISFGGDILLLDEPFKGLDKELKDKIIGLIKDLSKKCCVILITHENEDLLIADEIIKL